MSDDPDGYEVETDQISICIKYRHRKRASTPDGEPGAWSVWQDYRLPLRTENVKAEERLHVLEVVQTLTEDRVAELRALVRAQIETGKFSTAKETIDVLKTWHEAVPVVADAVFEHQVEAGKEPE